MIYEGGCLCGYIRFRAEGPALAPHTCSCRMCQRHSGALTLAWVEFPRDQVAWIGPGGAPATYRSSEVSSRAFCPKCGSTIGAIDDAPVIAIATGVMDRPGARGLKPAAQSYKGQRPRWWRPEIVD
ncbi:MAG: GFA family protein [Pseudomonadota bacterium]